MTTEGSVFGVLARLVWNRAERRPTAPVRVVTGLVLVVVVAVAVQLGFGVVLSAVESAVADRLGVFAVYAGLGGGTLVAAVAVDRRTVADLGFGVDRDWWLDLAFGLALGAGLMSGVFLVALGAAWIRVTGTFVADASGGFGVNFLFLVALFVAVGVVEELLLRGWLLTNLAEGFDGVWTVGRRGAVVLAVALSSAVFGGLHATNPNATLASTVGITLAGVLLASGYVLTDELAIPVGIHVTWNLFQGGVYGFPVSGLDLGVRVVAVAERGPDLFTGGRFGPEAGLLGVGAVVLGTGLVTLYVRLRTGGLRLDTGVTTPDLR